MDGDRIRFGHDPALHVSTRLSSSMAVDAQFRAARFSADGYGYRIALGIWLVLVLRLVKLLQSSFVDFAVKNIGR